jgi:hypothetical protein
VTPLKAKSETDTDERHDEPVEANTNIDDDER